MVPHRKLVATLKREVSTLTLTCPSPKQRKRRVGESDLVLLESGRHIAQHVHYDLFRHISHFLFVLHFNATLQSLFLSLVSTVTLYVSGATDICMYVGRTDYIVSGTLKVGAFSTFSHRREGSHCASLPRDRNQVSIQPRYKAHSARS